MPQGRPPDSKIRCDSDADTSEAVPSHAKGLLWPVPAVPEPIGCSIRARELHKVDNAAAGSVGRVPSTRPVAVMENRPERPPELEGEDLERGRQVADSIRLPSVRKPRRTQQYTNAKLDDVPGCPADGRRIE